MAFICTKGHNSDDADYCSECGIPINSNIVNLDKPLKVNNDEILVEKELCPDCGTNRNNGARFCEVCRYDFQTKTPYTVDNLKVPIVAVDQQINSSDNMVEDKVDDKVIDPALILKSEEPENLEEISFPEKLIKLNVVIKVDPSLITDEESKETCPKDMADRVFPLDLDENLLGRRSAAKKIYPEIEINDTGVSHRHLKFIKQKDSTFAVLELGSANGTILNGSNLESGIITPVKAGDEFIIGMWTRIELCERD